MTATTTTTTDATATSSRGQQPTFGAITHVALTVRDLSVSVPWYRTVIGAEPVLDEDTGPFRHVVFALGDTLLGLHEFPELVDDGFDPRRPGLDHVAFSAPNRSALDGWRERFSDLGIECDDVVDAHYGSGLSFKDPDGLALELFCAPGS
ncbi:MAG: VOC family protein [Actinomycetes bacterium]